MAHQKSSLCFQALNKIVDYRGRHSTGSVNQKQDLSRPSKKASYYMIMLTVDVAPSYASTNNVGFLGECNEIGDYIKGK